MGAHSGLKTQGQTEQIDQITSTVSLLFPYDITNDNKFAVLLLI